MEYYSCGQTERDNLVTGFFTLPQSSKVAKTCIIEPNDSFLQADFPTIALFLWWVLQKIGHHLKNIEK